MIFESKEFLQEVENLKTDKMRTLNILLDVLDKANDKLNAMNNDSIQYKMYPYFLGKVEWYVKHPIVYDRFDEGFIHCLNCAGVLDREELAAMYAWLSMHLIQY